MTQAKSNLKVTLEGRGTLVLRPGDHIATGGEGSVYRAGDMVVKVYTDPVRMRRDDMAGKIKLLSGMTHPFVVAPQGLVLGQGGEPLGYYMPFVSGEPLTRVFTNDFRTREGFGDRETRQLVDRMRETVRFAHEKQATLVDANELNWLVKSGGRNGPEPRVIDVDSWAIGRWPANVIMPSIRDWQSKGFDERTDWFAWGVVTFQVFSGIHPYKGSLDGFKRGDLEGRMRAKASVFMPGIGLNQAVRDFSSIPGPLLNWYEAAFQGSERSEPPSPFQTGAPTARLAPVRRVVATASGMLVYDKLYDGTSDPAIRVFSCGVVMTGQGRLIDLSTKREIGRPVSRDGEVIRVEGGWLKADWKQQGGGFSFVSNAYSETDLSVQATLYRVVRSGNRMFAVTDTGLTELVVRLFGKPVLSLGRTWGVMRHALQWFDGIGVQDALGAMYLVAPFGKESCAYVRVPELDGLKPIAAKAGHRFAAVIAADASGTYRKFEFAFDSEYRSYTLWQGVTDDPDLNVAILPKGVCATIVDDGELTIFVPANGGMNRVKDQRVTTALALANWEDKVVYLFQGEVWQVRLKQ
jgi:hypothetical protein